VPRIDTLCIDLYLAVPVPAVIAYDHAPGDTPP
jgi:hypothetical protein